MSFSNLNSPSAALRVCVDQSDNGRISGKVYSQRLTRPMAFSDMGSLILRLDEVLEKQNFPQAFQHSRSFREHESNVPASADPSDGIPLEEVVGASGALATFTLYVMSRRNASWQGWVDWMDGSPRQQFASALELIRLAEDRFLCGLAPYTAPCRAVRGRVFLHSGKKSPLGTISRRRIFPVSTCIFPLSLL